MMERPDGDEVCTHKLSNEAFATEELFKYKCVGTLNKDNTGGAYNE